MAEYYNDVISFGQYLVNTENAQIIIEGTNYQTLGDETLAIPYMHRWKPPYRKRVLARVYKAEQFAIKNKSEITMTVFTGYQRGYTSIKETGKENSILDVFNNINSGIDSIRWYLKDQCGLEEAEDQSNLKSHQYMLIWEFHKSGYPHLNMISFNRFTDKQKHDIKKIWSDHKIGSYEHGVNFQEGNYKNIRNYCIKYVAKGLVGSDSLFTPDKRDYLDIVKEWSPGEIVFNAVMWRYGIRLWRSSQQLGKEIKLDKRETKLPVIWTRSLLRNPSGDTDYEIWSHTDIMNDDGLTPRDILIKFKHSQYVKPLAVLEFE